MIIFAFLIPMSGMIHVFHGKATHNQNITTKNNDKKIKVMYQIFDSEVLICEIWDEIAKEYNLSNMDEVMVKCIGVNNAETEKIMKEEYGEDFDYDFYRGISSQIYHSRYDDGKLPMKEGVFELLEFLKQNGYKTALASSTRIETVTNQLKAAEILSKVESKTDFVNEAIIFYAQSKGML